MVRDADYYERTWIGTSTTNAMFSFWLWNQHDGVLAGLPRLSRTDRTYDNLLSLKLCNKKLKKVSKVKFLGVIIDEKLKWQYHIDHLQQKLKLSIVMIKISKQFIPRSEYLKLYNALFIPHLTYCISVWVGFLIIDLLNFFLCRKDVYVSYLKLN